MSEPGELREEDSSHGEVTRHQGQARLGGPSRSPGARIRGQGCKVVRAQLQAEIRGPGSWLPPPLQAQEGPAWTQLTGDVGSHSMVEHGLQSQSTWGQVLAPNLSSVTPSKTTLTSAPQPLDPENKAEWDSSQGECGD